MRAVADDAKARNVKIEEMMARARNANSVFVEKTFDAIRRYPPGALVDCVMVNGRGVVKESLPSCKP